MADQAVYFKNAVIETPNNSPIEETPMKNPLPTALSAAVWTLCSLCAQAQQTPAEATSNQPADTSATAPLAEVVITAEKRAVSAQKTAIAVTALSARDIEKKGIAQIDDLQYNAPGVTVANAGGVKLVNIRGLGLGVISPSTSSGVINYRDGVLITHEPFLMDPYFDVGTIEVLRGPQGTLAGSNSTGGAVLVNSKLPTFDGVHGMVEQTVGNHGQLRTQAALNVPLAERVAVRVAVNKEDRDSVWTAYDAAGNALPKDRTPGDQHQKSVRISLLAQPTDALKVLLRNEQNWTHNNGVASQPSVYSSFYASAPHGEFQLARNVDTVQRQRTSRSLLQLDWAVSPSLTLRSQTAYTYAINEQTDDTDASLADGGVMRFRVPNSTVQQEINLLTTDNDPVQWNLGAFWYKDKQDNEREFYLLRNPPMFFMPATIYVGGQPKAETTALFGQTTWQFTPTWQVLAGLRYSNDLRESTVGAMRIVDPTGVTVMTVPNQFRYEKANTTGKVGLNWTPDRHNLVYAFVAKGAKSGGYNTAGALFQPEEVMDYELGWKSTLWGGHLKTQLGAFYNDYKNIQLNVFVPPLPAAVANAATATIRGLEGSFQLRSGAFGADGGLAYIQSRLGEGSLADERYPAAAAVSLSGRRLPFSPTLTANLGADVTWALGDAGDELTLRGQLSHVARQWGTVFQVSGRDEMPSRTLVDLRATYRNAHGLRVEGFVMNAFDKRYIQALDSSATTDSRLYGLPRTFGVKVGYDF